MMPQGTFEVEITGINTHISPFSFRYLQFSCFNQGQKVLAAIYFSPKDSNNLISHHASSLIRMFICQAWNWQVQQSINSNATTPQMQCGQWPDFIPFSTWLIRSELLLVNVAVQDPQLAPIEAFAAVSSENPNRLPEISPENAKTQYTRSCWA